MPRVSILCLALLSAIPAGAQPIPEADVPEPLRKWIPWALDGADDRLCPAVNNAAVCLWPGRLTLGVSGQGGSFSQDVFADRALDLPLPGGDKRWPQSVRLDGRPAAVLERSGRPLLRLTPGAHAVDGRFAWDRLPDSLPLPPTIAIVDLSVEGRPIALPRRESDGLLLLRQGGAQAGGGENLQIKVFRRLADGIPLWIDTRVVFEVSGRAREVPLTGALVSGAVPVAVSGELPARLDADGRLRVQARAGTFTVRVLSRLAGRPESVELPKTAAPWPSQEVWVFEADERLRQVSAGGPSAIDPSRTDLPDEWRSLPAFLLEADAKLTLKEVSRGEPDSAPDQIALARTLWLDEGGRGLTVRDAFSGQLGGTTRLNLAAPGELGSVSVDGQGQVVTRDPKSGESGIELRRSALALQADSRLARRLSIPAVGWTATVQSLRAQLLLPPGWRLLGTTGVDSSPGSWLSRWNLFGFFFVLLTTLAVGRLFGPRWGLLTLLALALDHGEIGAPRLVWLSIVAALALLRVVPAGGLRTLSRLWLWASLLVLVLVGVPFLVDQIRGGLFPQVERGGDLIDMFGDIETGGMAKNAPAAPPPPEAQSEAAPAQEEAEDKGLQVQEQRADRAKKAPFKTRAARQVSNSLSASQVETKAYEQDPHAIVQTGAGVPSWTWQSCALVWSGPVDKAQTMRLFLLSPRANLLLALLRVVLTLALALRLAGRRPPIAPAPIAPAAAVALLLALAPGAHAEETPSPQLLQELQKRLTRPPACAPHCVTTASMQLLVEGSDLRLVAEVHAGATGAWPVPGPAESWVPRSVTLDGKPAEGLMARLGNGFLHLHVSAGVHQVTVLGPLPPRDSLTLQFGEKPRRATAAAPGWQVDGIHEDGAADDSVQLSRKLAAVAAAGGERGYEPWLEVTRVLDIGVSWSVETIVKRISPPGAPVVVKVPLLKGMLVTDADRQVKDNEILITLGRDQMETRWSATLKPVEGETVTLEAPEGRPWSEVWQVNCGLVWQCDASGLPPVSRTSDGLLAPEFRPWPGEQLKLTFRKPQGAAGQTLTVDRATLQLQPGIRKENGSLDLQLRASRAGLLALTLPDAASVQELTVDGTKRPIRPDARTLNVTIEAGEHPVHVAWQGDSGLGILYRVPAVDIGRPAVNGHVTLQLPEDRWLLALHGPAWGPAVLFWGYLLVVLLVASVLARLPGSRLTGWEWLLLALGLTQIPLFAAVVVAGWFLVLGWRRDRVLPRAVVHDLMQIGLVLWTLLALVFLYGAVHQGLLLRPEMQVAGGGSSATQLQWYADRVAGAMPRPWVLSLPLWVYRVAMLAWSLWLALALVRWLPWAWSSFSSGALWQPVWKRKQAPATPPA